MEFEMGMLLFWVGIFYLQLGLFYLQFVFVAYGNSALLLTVEIWFGLCFLRWKIGLTFLLTVPAFRKLELFFLAHGPHTWHRE